MAKARQALSLWRGRAGGIVYSVKGGQQIISAAASKTTNPRTTAQVLQRMKVAPAQNFYRQLEGLVDLGLISHTFQGRKYGNENRLRFLQLAMLNNQGPYVPKDTMAFIPFDYQISEGSLPSFTGRVEIQGNVPSVVPANPTVLGDGTPVNDNTIKHFATGMGCEVGDQVTIFYVQEINGAYVPTVYRWVVGDLSGLSAEPDFGEIFGSGMNIDFDIVMPDNYDITTQITPAWGSFYLKVKNNGNEKAAAGAVIISRKQANGTYLRSTEYLAISDDIRNKYYTPAALQAAIDSYNGTSVNGLDDPYYNNNASGQSFPGKIYASSMAYKLANNTTGRATILWGLLDNGNKVIFTEDGTAAGGVISIDDTSWTAGPCTPAQITTSVQWAGLYKWDDAFYTQWHSGQRAVRPIN